MADAPAIGLDEARRLLAPLRHADRILLAVSGGPDSIALMHLAAEVAAAEPWPPMIVGSVDHGMQEGSAAIAREVADRARALGLSAHVLVWGGRKPRTGVQAAARVARYALLRGLAAETQASHLVTAHTLDDQAETILFRMARGSGPVGLIGMRASLEHDGLSHLRPLLTIAKVRLLATCRRHGWRFVEDAANRDPRFARTRLRALMPLLAAEGLDATALAALGDRLAVAEAAILTAARTLHDRAVRPAPPHHRAYDAPALFGEPRAVVTALLNDTLCGLCRAGPPRLGRLEALVDQLDRALKDGRSLSRTLHGALLTVTRDGKLEIKPEAPRRRGVRGAEPSDAEGPV